MIAEYLPIKDILSLAKSTKAYLAILSDQTYWASVFNYEAECGFFYEGTHMRNIPELNWISIYQRTTYTKDIPAVKKRNSIWSLAKGIKELLELHPPYENDGFCGGHYMWKDGIEDVPKVGGLDASARRLEIAADIKALEVPNERLIESCRILHEQYFCKTIPCQKISFQSLFSRGAWIHRISRWNAFHIEGRSVQAIGLFK